MKMPGEQLPLPGSGGRVRRQPESVVVSAVRDYLRRRGWMVIRNVAGIGTYPGLADLQALREGRHAFIECKTSLGRLSSAQEAFRDEVEAHGGVFIVARCIADVERLA